MTNGAEWIARGARRIAFGVAVALFFVAGVGRAQVPPVLPLPMTSFNQAFRDLPGSWGGFAMGTAGCQDRIAGAGCLVTCFAMVLDYYQVELSIPAASSSTGRARRGMDPGILNDWLKAHSGYGRCAEDRVGNCCLEWTNLPPEISVSFHENKSDTAIDAASRQVIDRALASGHPVVAGVHWGRFCHGTTAKSEDCHWVVISGKTGTTYSIVDPYDRDSGSREGVRATLADGVFGNYIIDRFAVVAGAVPAAPRPHVDLEIAFEPRASLREGDVQSRLVRVTGTDQTLLLFARVIDPQGKISYAHYTNQDPAAGEPLLYSETERSVYPQARRFADSDQEWNRAVLTQGGSGAWVWEMWVEDPARPDEPLAYDLVAYTVAPSQAPGSSAQDALAVALAIGLAVLLTALVYAFALADR